MKRNWAEICKISDYHVRTALSLTTDHKILAGLKRGFPECFLDGEDEGPLRIPLSVLKEAAAEVSRKHWPENWVYDKEFVLGFGCDAAPHLRIPVAHIWGDTFPPVPDFVRQQLVGQTAQAGLVVNVDGKKFVVGSITFTAGYPEIGSVIHKPPELDDMYLFDADFIDLES